MKDSKVEGLKKRIKADTICTIVMAIIMLGLLMVNMRSVYVYEGDYSGVIRSVVLLLVAVVVLIILSIMMIEILRKGKPFSKSVIMKLRVLAVWVILGAFLPNVVTMILEFTTTQQTELSIGITEILIAILGMMIGMISEVFYYGYELQDDMDSIA